MLVIIVGNITNKLYFQQVEVQEQMQTNISSEEAQVSQFEYKPQLYLSSPTKCFDCERQMINPRSFTSDFAWMGKPTKCFDCEKEIIQQQGDYKAGNIGHGTKCFSCEKKLNDNYVNRGKHNTSNCYAYKDIEINDFFSV
jgi:DNA-directed RNA polymerase subunit N (RpoN/RPB10)